MRDLTPKEVELRNFVVNTVLGVYKKFGFSQIETPCVEDINLLCSGEGGENEKMLFKILKRGEKLNLNVIQNENDLVDLGLRYDLTVPLCRFYARNKAILPQNFKVIQIGSVWRAERQQKGRFRQFTQCDIDIIGVPNVIAEIELILATSEALIEVGFKNFKVRISDRRILENLAGYCGFEKSVYGKVFIILDKLDKIGLTGVKEELENSLFPQASIDKFIDIVRQGTERNLTVEGIKIILPEIDEKVLTDLNFVMDAVTKQAGSRYSIALDLSLVRGMGYYTGQIFEIEAENYKSSIAGGGRYDKMIGKILEGHEDIPACGFSIGFERVISILEEQNFQIPKTEKKIALLYDKNSSIDLLLSKAEELRGEGNIVSIEIKGKHVGKQLDRLAEQGFNSYAIFTEGQPVEIKPLNKLKAEG
ncbi:MAG: histidine--tRNA ligase [Deltaproteobacteria bacterium]|nr:histidine--tRNA ligase [Deltaproteobacteria bacterium]